MIRSAITVCLVPEARGGPFVLRDALADACSKAAQLGFDAIELFAPDADAVDPDELRSLLDKHGLNLAAVGTGAGALLRKLTLTAPEAETRSEAKQYIRSMIDLGGPFGAPAIIGSMQGRTGNGVDHETALGYLAEGLSELGGHAAGHGLPLLYEPLNRYETDLVNRVDEGVALLRTNSTQNVKLLADLFHMNIEEADLPAAIRSGGEHIGHVHFVDSNRRPAGCGHLDFAPIAEALRSIGFDGYASAEALPHPDPDEAARLTIDAFRRHFR